MVICMNKKKIVLTGGPGGGKTTATDLFRREFSKDVSVVPEAATMLFSAGVPRNKDAHSLRCIQRAIFNLQKNNESLIESLNQHSILLCDRASLDGIAYWPDSHEDFFKTMNTSLEKELSHYHAVIFFETAAKSGSNFKSGNPFRTEGDKEAIEIDSRLEGIWSQHPRFHLIRSQESFINKIMQGIETITKTIKTIKS